MALIDRTMPNAPAADGVGIRPAITGEHCCVHCGYRIVSRGPLLPDCPMCHVAEWRLVAWRPFSGQRVENGQSLAPAPRR